MIDEKVDAQAVSLELWKEAQARAKDKRTIWGLPYWSVGLNNLTGGAQREELSMVAARPGVGKSMFAVQNAVHVARYLLSEEGKRLYPDHVVKLVLCEMSAKAYQRRMTCQMSKVSQRRVMRGSMSPEQLERYHQALREIADLPIEYKDNSTGWDDTRQFLDRGNPTAWFAVDYIGIHPAGIRSMETKQTEKVAFLSRQFAEYSRSGPAGMLLVQLNRDAVKTADGRPLLSHLRDSGSLEQDASGFIGLLHRPDMNQKVEEVDSQRPKPAELIIAKQRNGIMGTIEMWWAPTLPGFVDESELADDLEDNQ